MLQTAPLSDMAKRPGAILETMTDHGPVALISKSTPQAIMVSPAEWNATARELATLRHQALCDWVTMEMQRNPDSVRVVGTKGEWMALLDE
ncbi:MAG: hypothetical protein K0U66_06315 [Gammaproteobacteria bacterium]|nr:hypothetical protein [Gammaproteobacteria bacterium]